MRVEEEIFLKGQPKGLSLELFRDVMRPGYARTYASVQGIDSHELLGLCETDHRNFTRRMFYVGLSRSHIGFRIM